MSTPTVSQRAWNKQRLQPTTSTRNLCMPMPKISPEGRAVRSRDSPVAAAGHFVCCSVPLKSSPPEVVGQGSTGRKGTSMEHLATQRGGCQRLVSIKCQQSPGNRRGNSSPLYSPSSSVFELAELCRSQTHQHLPPQSPQPLQAPMPHGEDEATPWRPEKWDCKTTGDSRKP